MRTLGEFSEGEKDIMMIWKRTQHKEMIGMKFGKFCSQSGSFCNGMYLIRVLSMRYLDMGSYYFFIVEKVRYISGCLW